jgi:diguanylate cyclase (GGDEF)-like protein
VEILRLLQDINKEAIICSNEIELLNQICRVLIKSESGDAVWYGIFYKKTGKIKPLYSFSKKSKNVVKKAISIQNIASYQSSFPSKVKKAPLYQVSDFPGKSGKKKKGKKALGKIYKYQVSFPIFIDNKLRMILCLYSDNINYKKDYTDSFSVFLNFLTYTFYQLRLEKRIKTSRKISDTQQEKISSLNKKIHALTKIDAMTDLPNRLAFNDHLIDFLLNTPEEQMMAIIFINLDRFNLINDSFGHIIGDMLLENVARRLRSIIPRKNVLARLGGDEFVILIPFVKKEKDIKDVADTVFESLHESFYVNNQEIFITCSLGIAIYPTDGNDYQLLLKNANSALHRAKDKGGNNYQFYTMSMNAGIYKRLRLENYLRKAIEAEEFRLFYQPQVCTQTEKIVGAEALLRWKILNKRYILPDSFIPVAEETNLIFTMGEWILRTACKQLKEWQEQMPQPFKLGINISALQFYQPNFIDTVESILEETKVDRRFVDIEITESVAMKDFDYTHRILSGLKKMGLMLSLDDFGTGYSSLSYLMKIPIDTIKIDQSFIREMDLTDKVRAIIDSIITLSHNLGLNIIAEGVETLDKFNQLKEMGCDEIQGYYISKPLPKKKFEEFLILRHKESIPS